MKLKVEDKSETFERKTFCAIKSITRSLNLRAQMPIEQKEFKTKLRFDPRKLSTGILKRYLRDILNGMEVEDLLAGDSPEEYTKEPDDATNYKVLKELGMMSVTEWKNILEANTDNIEQLYLHNDMMLQDSRYYYECWKIIQDEVGSHEKQMSFFRLISEIVKELSSRNVVEIVSKTHEYENIINGKVSPNTKIMHAIPTAPQGHLIKQEVKVKEVKVMDKEAIQMETINPPSVEIQNSRDNDYENSDDENVDENDDEINENETSSSEPNSSLLDDDQWKLNF